MTRSEYIEKLRDNLKRLPQEDIDSAVSYYDEYFDEAGEGSEQSVIKELGNPSAVASKIIGEYSLKEIEKETKTEDKKAKSSYNSNAKLLWIVLIAIFASPIAIPIAATIFGVAVSFLAIAFSLFVVFWAVGIGLSVGAVAAFVTSIFVLFIHFPTGLFLLGTSILLLCIGIGFLMVGWWLTATAIRLIAKSVSGLLVRRSAK